MKKTVITIVISLIGCTALQSQSEVEHLVFDKANQLYLSGEYAAARDEYLKIINAGFESVELYYNLGNTYYKLGQIPASILYMEKALKINPKEPDIRFNLSLANQLVVDKINPVNEFFLKRWIRALANMFSADSWGYLALGLLVLLLTLIALTYIDRSLRYRTILVPAAALAALFLIFSLVLGTIRNQPFAHPNSAIVFSSSLTAKSSPDQTGTDLFVIHEGLKVNILDKVGEWIRIRIPDGNEAWIPESSVVRI